MLIFFSIFSLISLSANAVKEISSALYFTNIISSHGILEPQFSPTTFRYDINIPTSQSSIAIVPEVSTTGYNGTLPVVMYAQQIKTPSLRDFKLFKPSYQFQMPADGNPLVTYFKISYPTISAQDYKVYTVKVTSSNKVPEVELFDISVTTPKGQSILVKSGAMPNIYEAFVDSKLSAVYLTAACHYSNTLTINKSPAASGKSFKITLDRKLYQQPVVVTCRYEKLQKAYILLLTTSIYPEHLSVPTLTIKSLQKQCKRDKSDSGIVCSLDEDPKQSKISLILDGQSNVNYSIRSLDNDHINVRLINGQPSSSFSIKSNSAFEIVATAGQYRKAWKLAFTGAESFLLMDFLALVNSLLVGGLVVTMLIVCGLANLVSIGSPIGMTEIVASVTFMNQFLCFTHTQQGTGVIEKLVSYTKFVTLFWPIPTMGMNFSEFWNGVGVYDLEHAYGCLLWSGLMLGTIITIHTFFICAVHLGPTQTFPHRMRIGAWEQRVVYWLLFPTVVASVSIIINDTMGIWKMVSIGILSLYVIWALAYSLQISSRLKDKSIVWVWQYPLNQVSDDLDTDSGYWSDAVCDQLMTQPVNRSVMGKMFPWQWTTTVGDIQPVNICLEMYARGMTESTNSDSMYDAYGDGAAPFGAVGRRVDVLQTVASKAFCPGHRLICGLLRCDWLDILFSYQAITKFYGSQHHEMSRRFVTIPLSVKTCQLTGPMTGGVAHFFFDGVKSPYCRIVDTILRYTLGVFVGLTLISTRESNFINTSTFSAILALASAMYYLFKCPFTRYVENVSQFLIYLAVGTQSLQYLIGKTNLSSAATITQVTACISIGALILLSLYTMQMLFLTYSAIICPPLEESKILENLANCTVTISNHADDWAVEVMSFTKEGVRDLKAQCQIESNLSVRVSVFPSGQEPNLEFSVEEILEACSTEALPLPQLVMFMSDTSVPLGYRWINIYDIGNAHNQIRSFFSLHENYKLIGESITKSLMHQLREEKTGKTVLCVTVIPPSKVKALS